MFNTVLRTMLKFLTFMKQAINDGSGWLKCRGGGGKMYKYQWRADQDGRGGGFWGDLKYLVQRTSISNISVAYNSQFDTKCNTCHV